MHGDRPLVGTLITVKSNRENYAARIGQSGSLNFHNLWSGLKCEISAEYAGFQIVPETVTIDPLVGNETINFEASSLCSFDISPKKQYVSPEGGRFVLSVTSGGCPWEAFESSLWLEAPVYESGGFAYFVPPLEFGSRSDVIAVADKHFIVDQRPFVAISGRAVTQQGMGVRGAQINIDTEDVSYSTTTSPLGYFRFDSVPSELNYRVTASSRRYRFEPREIVPVTTASNIVELVGLE